MLGIFLILVCLAFGWALIRLLPVTLTVAETVAAGAATGLLVGTWAILLPVMIFGFRSGLPLGIFVLMVTACYGWKRSKLKVITQQLSVGWIILTILTAQLFAYLHWTHDLLPQAGDLLSAGDTWGDIALHLTLASNLAAGNHFAWQFPLFHASQLTYPFLLDFTSSLLYRLGWDWHTSFLVPSVLLDLAIVQLMYAIAVRLSGRPSAGVIAVPLFLAGGSAAGWVYAVRDWKDGGFSSDFFSKLTFDYSHLVSANLQFTNTVTSELLPQRGFALGMATVLTCLLLLTVNQKKYSRLTIGFISLMIGLLPFAHVQSWEVGVILLIGSLSLAQDKRLLLAATPGIGVGALQLIWQIAHTNTGGFVRPYLGWMRGIGETLPHFWWLNFGLLLPLMLAVAWMLFRSADRFKQGLALIGVGLFVVCNLLILQPNPYDNIKLLLYWYLILCLFLGEWFVRHRWALPLAIVLCLPGMLSFEFDTSREYLEVNAEQIAWAAQVQRSVPPGEMILTSQQHNNPVSMLSGRPIFVGYPGWLWTYGITTEQALKETQEIYSGGPNASELLRQYGIQYVEVGPEERQQFAINNAYFEQFPTVATAEEGTLYRIR